MSTSSTRTRGFMVALICGIVLFAGAALGTIISVRTDGEWDRYDPSGLARHYTQAVIDGDIDRAKEFLYPVPEGPCAPIEWDTATQRIKLIDNEDDVGDPSVVGDSSTHVIVRLITVLGSGPLGADEIEVDRFFEVRRVDGVSVITKIPPELTVCAESGG